jgi:hypothetical protein
MNEFRYTNDKTQRARTLEHVVAIVLLLELTKADFPSTSRGIALFLEPDSKREPNLCRPTR